jgi:hypothetical protein
VQFTEAEIVSIARTPVGRIVWLERGGVSAGLTHIMKSHGAQFATLGLKSEEEVATLIINTLKTASPIRTDATGMV